MEPDNFTQDLRILPTREVLYEKINETAQRLIPLIKTNIWEFFNNPEKAGFSYRISFEKFNDNKETSFEVGKIINFEIRRWVEIYNYKLIESFQNSGCTIHPPL